MLPITVAQLAIDVLTMAHHGSMPDTYWSTDQRILRACKVLGIEPGATARDFAYERLPTRRVR